MSNRYTADGKRRSSMAHAKHAFTCTCGKVVHGNGGKSSHRRACVGRWLTSTQAHDLRMAAWKDRENPA